MPKIREIGVNVISISEIPSWRAIPPQSIPDAPPITLQLGFPVADIPGCVKTRNAQPGNLDAYDTDPQGNFVVCNGTLPSYSPLDFTPNTAGIQEVGPPIIDPPDEEKPAGVSSQPERPSSPMLPELPSDTIKVETELPCPAPDAIPLGAKNKSQTAVIIGYKVIDGRCEAQMEPLPILTTVGNYLPGAPVVVTTTAIAATATMAAVAAKPLGEGLLKAIKPIVKKVINKLKERMGKEVSVESVEERRRFQRSLRK
jgi:hypothetical protein